MESERDAYSRAALAYQEVCKERDTLRAENEKLRKALEPFADMFVSERSSCHEGLAPMAECGRCSKILAAREALAPRGQEGEG